MFAPVEWIRQYVELPSAMTVDEIVAAYIGLGLEVEEVHHIPETQGDLLVGQVLAIAELTEFKKPIRFCQVDLGAGNGPDGSDQPRGIICGAQNFAVGDKVIVSPPGTILPGGFEIASRKTYGHISDGMICSAQELGIGEDHDGIIVLDADAQVGVDARELIDADGAVIEFAITPDRGYALSIRGLARELAAATGGQYTDPAVHQLREAQAGIPVEIVATERCSRFVATSVTGVDPAAPSPWLIRRRLMAAGIRAISLAVDVTNYVMVELGQPLHAFDADKLDGGIVVRRAHSGEILRTLDGQDRTLTDDDVVVADHGAAVSLAGVMGGEATEISAATRNVVLEAASWAPPSISRSVRRHRLPSEAARRFERAVDPAVPAQAAEAAAQLLVRYGGGTLGGRTDAGAVPPTPVVVMPLDEPRRLTGRDLRGGAAASRLAQVGCFVDVRTSDKGVVELVVTPPTWRPDLVRAADLVEEIARLEGYDAILPILPAAVGGGGLTLAQRRRRRVADSLAAAGLTEVLSFPFVGPKDFDALGIKAADPRRIASTIANPLDKERPLMATTLLPQLLTTTVRNRSRGAHDLALFEIGQVVHPSAEQAQPPQLPVNDRPSAAQLEQLFGAVPDQPLHIAVVLAGAWERAGWWGKGRVADTTDIFACAQRIGAAAGTPVSMQQADLAPWHPGRCAAVVAGNEVIGHAGELHPAVIERLDLPARSLALEIDLSAFADPYPPVPPAVSAFPPVHMDVALTVSDDIPAGDVAAALRSGGGELLESVRLFDRYSGDQVAEGTISLAFALVVRAADRTLTAAEANDVRDAAMSAATQATGAQLRGA